MFDLLHPINLKGNASANELLAGSGDTIWLGAGGDIARGGGSADVFVVDVSASSTGGEILDLKNVDKLSSMMEQLHCHSDVMASLSKLLHCANCYHALLSLCELGCFWLQP